MTIGVLLLVVVAGVSLGLQFTLEEKRISPDYCDSNADTLVKEDLVWLCCLQYNEEIRNIARGRNQSICSNLSYVLARSILWKCRWAVNTSWTPMSTLQDSILL
jgi:hypothetical protein